MDNETIRLQQTDADCDKAFCYHFSSPEPYARCESLADENLRHKTRFDEDGGIYVKNPSARWLPTLMVQRQIGGTVYSVTGSFDGTETLDKKLIRVMEQSAKNLEEKT